MNVYFKHSVVVVVVVVVLGVAEDLCGGCRSVGEGAEAGDREGGGDPVSADEGHIKESQSAAGQSAEDDIQLSSLMLEISLEGLS